MRKRLLAAILFFACILSQLCSAKVTQFWLYKSVNLLVDANIPEVLALIQRAKACGVTHLLLTDSKFSRLAEMDERYFKNAGAVKKAAQAAGISIIPAVCPVGYSNDLLHADPNLIEALPVRNAPMVVKDGAAHLVSNDSTRIKGGVMSDLKLWGFRDDSVEPRDGSAYVRNPSGKNARLSQKVPLQPWRQYHFSVRVKTQEFHGTPEVKFLNPEGRALNYDYLKVQRTQNWTVHHAVFNSQDSTTATLYLGCWDGTTGELWWDDAILEEVAFLNLVRRDGAPLSIVTDDGKVLEEGRDFDRLTDSLLGTKPYAGCYTVWHEPPVLKTKLPSGTRLRASWHHGVTVHDDQACLCPSEPRSMALIKDQIERVNQLWEPPGFMMSHDEIRVWNQCAACRARNLSAGQLLADNVKACTRLIREVNPRARIYVWSDMFDPNHNARNDYYLARGDFAGAWEGLDKEVTIVPWYFEKRTESLAFFASRGHRQVIAGYYDSDPSGVVEWLKAAGPHEGVEAVMYTTWQYNYRDMETFFKLTGAIPRN